MCSSSVIGSFQVYDFFRVKIKVEIVGNYLSSLILAKKGTEKELSLSLRLGAVGSEPVL